MESLQKQFSTENFFAQIDLVRHLLALLQKAISIKLIWVENVVHQKNKVQKYFSWTCALFDLSKILRLGFQNTNTVNLLKRHHIA